jgi:hypothetical protein
MSFLIFATLITITVSSTLHLINIKENHVNL